MHTIITNTLSLQAFCERMQHESFIAIDTEFMREKTYYPQLCLVQIAGEKESAAIDPLAPDIDLAALDALLLNEQVLKVFHACKQDMEIFYHRMHALPHPIFDTQVAAMVCGYGESIGYESLVGKVLGLSVDKSSRFTDWSHRPLSDNQITYALNDVLHLYKIYIALAQELAHRGRKEWIMEEMQSMLDPENYDADPDEAWQKIRLRNASPRYLALTQAAARWREITARAQNIPRPRIMKDEIVAEIAHAKPRNFSALRSIRGFHPSLPAIQYETLFDAIKEAETLPISACPKPPIRKVLPEGCEALIDLLRLLLKATASEHHVVPRLIADKDDLEQLATGNRDHIHALTGWRYDIFGSHALRLLEGKIALKANDKNGIMFIDVV